MKHILQVLSVLLVLSVLPASAAVGDYSINYQANATGPLTKKEWAGGNNKLWGTNGSNAPSSFTLGTALSFDGTTLTLDADLLIYAGITPSANVQSILAAANYPAVRTLLSLDNVENTALSTWAGTTNVTTLGTITTGTWQGTDIALAYIAQGGATDGQVMAWNNGSSTWAPATLDVASAFEDITGDPTDNAELAKLMLGENVKSHGAVGDARLVPAVTVSTNTVTAAAGTFSAADNGKLAYLAVPGLNPSTARTVTYVDTDEITLSGTSLTSYSGADLILYTQDDTDEIIAACAAAKLAGTNVILPAGGYVISEPCLIVNHASLRNLPQVIGAGSGLTRFFVAPDYDYGELGYGDGVLTDVYNAANLRLSGFAIYGSYTDPGVGHKAIYVHSCFGRIDDVRVTSFRGGHGAGIYVSSCQVHLDRVHVEGNAGYGITIDGSTAYLMGCYHGNGTNLPGLYIYLSTVVHFGGTQDESTGHNILIQGSASRYTLIGGRVEGLAGAYAVQLDAGVARFIGCQLHPYNDHNNSGSISIASGATAIACGCTIKGTGTRYAVLNAGTYIDGGGNLIEGTGISSSGTTTGILQRLRFASLPTSDSGLSSGDVWSDSGTLKIVP